MKFIAVIIGFIMAKAMIRHAEDSCESILARLLFTILYFVVTGTMFYTAFIMTYPVWLKIIMLTATTLFEGLIYRTLSATEK